jgi:hypothetical protein
VSEEAEWRTRPRTGIKRAIKMGRSTTPLTRTLREAKGSINVETRQVQVSHRLKCSTKGKELSRRQCKNNNALTVLAGSHRPQKGPTYLILRERFATHQFPR